MLAFAIITWIASATCVFALIGLLGREAERADETTETTMPRHRTVENEQK
jgi:hypothetical protein